MTRLDETPVALPRWVLEIILAGKPLCNVCTGWSPPWDGHDKSPPCVGAAREALAAAVAAAADA